VPDGAPVHRGLRAAVPASPSGIQTGDRPGGVVFFLSDYGRSDEFVGVVHAVLQRLAPGCPVVDLTHDVPPFDVRAGAAALARCVAHLGPGVVLGVVDPGVGSARRGVVLEVAGHRGPDPGPRFFVGPDNGLLVAAAEAAGSVVAAYALAPPEGDTATFDGRDLFAPVAAALITGDGLPEHAERLDPGRLVRLAPPVVEHGQLEDGRSLLRCEVTWVDRFGNVELAGRPGDLPPDLPLVVVGVDRGGGHPPGEPARAELARPVRTFSDLDVGEVGVLVDASGHLAVVTREASASERLEAAVGMLVDIIW